MRVKYISVIIILSLLLCGCTNYISDNHSFGTDSINAGEFSFIVKDEEGNIYYQDGENSNSISRYDGNIKETYTGTYGMSLNIYQDYLYYRDFKNGLKLMRLEINNPDNRQEITDINTHQSIVIDNHIYANILDLKCDKEDGLYRISLDGSKKKRLVKDSINDMQYDSNYLYYCSQTEGKLFRIDLNGSNKSEILIKDSGKFIATTHFIVDDGWIYFENLNTNRGGYFNAVSSELGICRVKSDGTNFEELVDGHICNIYEDNGQKYLLYTNDDKLSMLNLDTKETEFLFSGKITAVNVFEDEVYMLNWQNETNKSVIYKINIKDREIRILGENK
ncbi:DUF5050 domain-containing protein [Oceanirhabdus sp. W0125-5]|uniref:DUF5050 domain-containing protein n=1 Tax=Oceanirhabdus sp. W0125-5 TaxID=2999116 RepID=UPI0022F341B9|nr:DUF5050 domain-containing protein [Oceanirhabdus sp. W0125-5]WBW96206.1 DUF5050 domain-containing protein [Oceanirhabdus sp. W0125-5]